MVRALPPSLRWEGGEPETRGGEQWVVERRGRQGGERWDEGEGLRSEADASPAICDAVWMPIEGIFFCSRVPRQSQCSSGRKYRRPRAAEPSTGAIPVRQRPDHAKIPDSANGQISIPEVAPADIDMLYEEVPEGC